MAWTRTAALEGTQKNNHEGERGAALAEFAIVTPALLIVLFWSIYFADVMMVRLKLLELSRTATWESTVMRDPAAVKQDLEERFRNLHSDDRVASDPGDFIGIKDVEIKVEVKDNEAVNMVGRADWSGVPGVVTSFMDSIGSGLGSIVDYLKLNPKGMAKSEVQITVSNGIIPGAFEMLGTTLGDERLKNPFVFKETQYLVWDTWKAWPSTYSTVNTSTQTDPSTSYYTTETMVADQLKSVAFFGLNKIGVFSKIDTLVSKGGMPWFFSTESDQRTGGGPVAMRPAAKITDSWVPGYGMAPYRVGDKYFDDYRKSGNGWRNPSVGIDRARPTLPFKTASGHWNDGGSSIAGFSVTGDGGYGIREISSPENDYFNSYECRGHYYEGMIKEDGKLGDDASYQGCEGSAWSDLLDGLGLGSIGGMPSLPSLPSGGP